MNQLLSDLAEVLLEHGVINENQFTHVQIKNDFEKLRRKVRTEEENEELMSEFNLSLEEISKTITVEKAEKILADKYFLDPTTIHGIIYRKKRNAHNYTKL